MDDIEQRVRRALQGLDAPWETIPIDPDYADTAAFCARYGIPLEHSGNTIIVASRKEPRQHAACLVTATTRLDVNHAVRRVMGVARLSFASAEETRALTGMEIGGVTILGLPPGLPIYVDAGVMALPWVVLGSGSRRSKIRIAPEPLRALPGLVVVPGLSTTA